jgi:hypothetical protein
MVRFTKSKNLDLYPHFFEYKEASSIDFHQLGEDLDVEPNRLRGMMRAIKHDSTIYLSLQQAGYADEEIPHYFKRPEKPKRRRKPHVEQSETAQERSAQQTSYQKTLPPPPTAYSIQGETAQPLSTLSERSAPWTQNPQFLPMYKTPMEQLIDQVENEIINGMLKDMTENPYTWGYRRKTHLTFDDILTIAEAQFKTRQMEMQNAFQVFSIMNAMQPRPPVLTKEDFTELMNKLYQITEKNKPSKETHKTTQSSYNINKSPNPNPKTKIDLTKEIRETISYYEKRDKEDMILMLKTRKQIQEKKYYKRTLRQKMDKKINEKLMQTFYKILK